MAQNDIKPQSQTPRGAWAGTRSGARSDCDMCGKPLGGTFYAVGVYCSDACGNKAQRIRNKESQQA